MSEIPKIPDRPGNPVQPEHPVQIRPDKPEIPGHPEHPIVDEPGKIHFRPIVPEPTPPVSFPKPEFPKPKPEPEPEPKDKFLKAAFLKAAVNDVPDDEDAEPKRPPIDNPVLYQLGIDVEVARKGRLLGDIPRYDDYWKVVERLRQYYNNTKNVNLSALVQKIGDEVEPKIPVIESLVPDKATLGDASFTLHVKGTGFDRGSRIVFASHEEPTTYVSETEITTGINMDVWQGPDVLTVYVLSREDVASNNATFTFVTPTRKVDDLLS